MDHRYINLDYLKEMSGGKKELMLEMIGIFNSEVPGYLDRMNLYLEEENWDSLGKLAHKARASASIMGMHELVNELIGLERLSKEKKDTEKYSSYILNIEKKFHSAIEELNLISKTL
jgi:HPt (histidine-containing phosphotransfer) domain-containing protein